MLTFISLKNNLIDLLKKCVFTSFLHFANSETTVYVYVLVCMYVAVLFVNKLTYILFVNYRLVDCAQLINSINAVSSYHLSKGCLSFIYKSSIKMDSTILDVYQLKISHNLLLNYWRVTQELFYAKALQRNWIRRIVNKLNDFYTVSKP